MTSTRTLALVSCFPLAAFLVSCGDDTGGGGSGGGTTASTASGNGGDPSGAGGTITPQSTVSGEGTGTGGADVCDQAATICATEPSGGSGGGGVGGGTTAECAGETACISHCIVDGDVCDFTDAALAQCAADCQ